MDRGRRLAYSHGILVLAGLAGLKSLLTLKGGPQIVIVSAPWYLADWMPERRRLFDFRPR